LKKIKNYRENGKSCSQATLMGICEVAGLPVDELYILASGFSGGIGGTFDDGTCGAVTGAIMALGFLGQDDSKIKAMSKELYNSFKEEYNYVTCGEISKKGEDKSPCVDVCLFAGEKVCKLLSEN